MSAENASRTPWGLVLSVALNGLLIGLLAGVMRSGGPHKRGGPPGGPEAGPAGGDRGLARAIIQSAPADARPELRRAMSDAWASSADDRARVRSAQKTISDAVAAETFDQDAVLAAFEDWREADTRIKARVQTAMADLLAEIPPDARKALAEQMRRHESRRQRRRDRVRQRMQERRN